MGGSSVGVHTTRGRLQCKCLRLESDKDSCCLARIAATVSFLWHCLPRHKETHGATCVFVCVRVLPYLSWAETKRFLWAAGSRDQRTAGRCEEGSSAELTPLRGCDSLETEGTLRGGGGREETLTFWCFNCTFTSEVFFTKQRLQLLLHQKWLFFTLNYIPQMIKLIPNSCTFPVSSAVSTCSLAADLLQAISFVLSLIQTV